MLPKRRRRVDASNFRLDLIRTFERGSVEDFVIDGAAGSAASVSPVSLSWPRIAPPQRTHQSGERDL